jgi:hypothetical protein
MVNLSDTACGRILDYHETNHPLANSVNNERVSETAQFLFPRAYYASAKDLYPDSPLAQQALDRAYYIQKSRVEADLARKNEYIKKQEILLEKSRQSIAEVNTITAEMVRKPLKEALDSIEESKDTYETLYWKYVNATDTVKAAEALANMLAKVTMDLEPNHDMSSWVEEPKTEVVKKHTHWHIRLGYAFGFWSIMALIGHFLSIWIH